MKKEELWRTIKGRGSRYQASNFGRVRDLGLYASNKKLMPILIKRATILTPSLSQDGLCFYFLLNSKKEFERVLAVEIFHSTFVSQKKCVSFDEEIESEEQSEMDIYDFQNQEEDEQNYPHVRKQSRSSKYFSSINVAGKEVYLGSFITKKEAYKAYLAAEEKYKEVNKQYAIKRKEEIEQARQKKYENK